jgi:hypothetical protein
MVNNTTNINKTNNHLLPQIIKDNKRPGHMALKDLVQTLDRLKNVSELNLFMDSNTPPIHNWISKGNTDINKQ